MSVHEVLKDFGIKTLRPPQEKVLDNGLLEKNKNFLVCIPTASGKTLIGEMAFINHLLDENKKPTNKKAIFIVPLKALATEKYEEFKEKYEKYGLKIGISIGDFDSKEDLSSNNLIITTSEKLDSLIRHKIDWLEDVSCVVIDEIHLIGDGDRGATLEVVLTILKSLELQIIGLSATVGNPGELADWLNAKLVIDSWRPIELRKATFFENTIEYTDKKEKDVKRHKKNPLENLVIDTVNEDGSCLIFCSSKRNAVGEAKKHDLREYLHPLEVEKLIEVSEELLSSDSEGKTVKTLADCVKKGIAFHHAGLTTQQRKIVESAYRNRIIKVICCTPTLSAGLNMPCRRAIIRDVKRFSDNGMKLIPVMEIHQCIGRAGRPGLDPYGEGIVVLKKKADVMEALNLLNGDPEHIYSGIANYKSLEKHILGLIASDITRNKTELYKFLKNTFYAYQYDDFGKIKRTVEEILFDFKNSKLVRPENEILEVTALGLRVSELYISPSSAIHILDGLKGLENYSFEDHILLTLSGTHEMKPKLRTPEDNSELRNELESLGYDTVDDLVDDFFYSGLFKAWINESTDEEIHENFAVEPGILRYKLEQMNWMIYSAKELLRISENLKDYWNEFSNIEVRLKYGASEELVELLKIRGIGRVKARKLYDVGIKTREDIKKNPYQVVAQLGNKTAVRVLKTLKVSYDLNVLERKKGQQTLIL
ncbi:DEAD/DEAH box helicase domain protein [Methanococcus maripaludis C5]|uniref:ATP-dependent DNA helicase Hel308 n=1 Tax=Methanococcus maripaludis (strain C5 / ATCC BAA-1333) TaxID=402880 RepID=A4FYF9_METM5|nr:DEAD/DEAH box helicase [Methanococcus maripaludis]ABO35243.1 DEAD/DEAH box helicase domain protein [Methanococcus maripaludis C5]